MHSLILQDWGAFAGNNATPFVQQDAGWLDLAPFQDVVIYVDVREVSGAVTIAFETSPTKDDALFQPMFATATTLVASSVPTVLNGLLLSANVPLARFLRWKLTGPASSWDTTFRVLVAANSPGM